jgi:hypothetical protein
MTPAENDYMAITSYHHCPAKRALTGDVANGRALARCLATALAGRSASARLPGLPNRGGRMTTNDITICLAAAWRVPVDQED